MCFLKRLLFNQLMPTEWQNRLLYIHIIQDSIRSALLINDTGGVTFHAIANRKNYRSFFKRR
jgi:hypothetical protein